MNIMPQPMITEERKHIQNRHVILEVEAKFAEEVLEPQNCGIIDQHITKVSCVAVTGIHQDHDWEPTTALS
jgi:hypothetical protein